MAANESSNGHKREELQNPGNSDKNTMVLINAVQEGSLEDVVELLEADFFGQTPLHYAAEFGHADIAKRLIDAGADAAVTHVTNKYGLSALHTAACKGQEVVARLLIQAGCDPDAADVNGTTPLHCAVSNGHMEVIQLLLDAKARLNMQVKVTNRTPLFLACEVNNLAMVDLLLKRGARVNTQDAYGMTPLCALCLYNNTDISVLLMEHGAKVNQPDNRLNTPLHYAARHGNSKIIRMLNRRRSAVNMKNKHGETPLHVAVRMCHVDTADLLLSFGADPNGSTSYATDNPLHLAVQCFHEVNQFEQVLRILLNHGVDLDHRSHTSNMSALFLAIHLGKSSHSQLLIQHGASPNVECPYNMTILHKACQKNDSASATLLLLTPIQWHRETWLRNDIHTSGINPKLLKGYAKHIPMVLLNHLDSFSLIQHVVSNPFALMHLCRSVVRKLLGTTIEMNLLQLGLPKRLNDYMMLKIT